MKTTKVLLWKMTADLARTLAKAEGKTRPHLLNGLVLEAAKAKHGPQWLNVWCRSWIEENK